MGPEVEFRRSDYDTVAAADAVRALGAPVDEQLLAYLVDPPTSDETTAYFEALRAS
jgi:hypothetical protein